MAKQANLGNPKAVERYLKQQANALWRKTEAAIPRGYDRDARRVVKAMFVQGFIQGGLYMSKAVSDMVAAEERKQANE